MKLDILAIAAHPDDVELSCSGTILRHIDMGHKVGLLDLTRGELGTRGTPEIRIVEANEAARIMGATVRENLGMADGFFTHSQENILAIAQVIRHYQPDIILANALNDRHPDHARAAKLTSDACFFAGLVRVETIRDGEVQQPWRVKNIYHYTQDFAPTHVDFVVDITPYMEKKIECVQAFRSQFYDPNSTAPETPISTKAFLDFLYGRARHYGRAIGAEFGEAFQTPRTPGVKDLFQLQ